MSAPISKTFLVCANVSAVFTEMVVLPSPFIEDETNITGHWSFLLKKYFFYLFGHRLTSLNVTRAIYNQKRLTLVL